MRTSTTTPSTDTRRWQLVADQRGFTLIEIGLVLLILGVLLALTVPRLRDRTHSELVSHTRRLAVTVRFLRSEAILTGRTHRLIYDLAQHRYWAESADESSGQPVFSAATGAAGRGVSLPEPIAFIDIAFPLAGAKVQEGMAFTDFYPDGFVDATVVHLGNAESGLDVFTLRVDPFTGNVYVTDRYQDFDYSA